MTNVLTYGTFDLFHVGHSRILQRARALGTHLTVAVSTDEFNAVKGKRSVYPYSDRTEILSSLRYVDRVIPEENWGQKRSDIKKYEIDILVMGSDWAGKFDDCMDLCKVVYLDRTEGISSSEIKAALARVHDLNLEQLRLALQVAAQIVEGIK